MSKKLTNNPIENAINLSQMTQDLLAEKLDVTRQTIINYRNFPDTIPAGKLMVISKLTGISLEQLVGGSLERAEGPKLKPTYINLYSKLEHAIKKAEDHFMIFESTNEVNEEVETKVIEVE